MSTWGNWGWHLAAALLGVLLSLSVVYKKLEDWLGVYRPLQAAQIRQVTGAADQVWGTSDPVEVVARYNRCVYLGKNSKYVPDFTDASTIELKTGTRLVCARGDRFLEVGRIRPNGRTVYYWLLPDWAAN
ncbi:hypothetical protein GCM10025857_02010 [Alicyclobacillus contaminans]|uniref:hypothetical protein n=1 Tax=Alicyclobacillus contaminans TaxID=392016 RepID=UPI0004143E1A|nr:hypothetical protein [Alicyclobacillus contaminans]GMA48844.1 hypothetical protein GCM10025857_02010 [Alicyclobacillus contaminans]